MSAPDDKPHHPGETLARRFMEPNRLGINQLARALAVPPNRISAILSGQRSITADTALRLARFFDTTALYWMNLQARYDLALTQQVLGEELRTTLSTLKDHQRTPLDNSPVAETAPPPLSEQAP
ncbi:HigA family addiction module antitoxin [Rhodospirillum rubrum]|uniref:Plasmid maintenance system antidote protein n=1 Tax=Rhodospirillum rubrum (strain ATCC 11170 / ATH 1.1.1 / DSM 467 / LMG 4362 / NCIMB 8255 / S1) TaxID=269796 RepID=Q2RU60_RHORT|nr:HigA family addiction module antitoxin [Rhodospirillum rubrum]ABC22335.1 Plasmid maintenance system antidote protein [Rhodospirillum rubrum ATCC 11170]AEO48051.1 plasmid maintenance system antidote protein [Rhodospirillum rubrum F11]MBK5953915.1 transcriptional regulator [Rhodospirillum rubrum]QXG81975.1 HigA family addiction module antidote protein [Rhodospirillum rubrum]HCF16862.1 addiction module antidote protein, HigA family [Rhodospirillum rubrum]